jgi:hypothetical protein
MTLEKYAQLVQTVYREMSIPNASMHAKRLIRSVYPTQWNDYIMLRKYFIKRGGPKVRRWVPADATIYPLIYNLNQHGFNPSGWDAGSVKFKEHGFIYLHPGGSRKTRTYQMLKACADKMFKNVPQVSVKTFNDGVTLNFKPQDVSAILGTLGLRPSTKQILPGADTIRKRLKWTIKKMNALHAPIVVEDLD